MSDFKIVKLLNSPVSISFPGVITYRGVYAGATSYVIGDSVSYNGSSYVALGSTTGNLPTNATFWQLLAAQGATGATGATGPTGPAGSYGYTPANDSLSNLGGTSINTDLNPGAPDTYNMGVTGNAWNMLFVREIGVEGSNFINVFTRKMFSDDGQESANFQTRCLSDQTSAIAVDYQNRFLKDASNLKAMDWQSRQAYDRTEIQSIHFEDRILYANDGATSVLNWSQTTGATTITQSANDNSTNIATTAYVDSGLSLKEPTLTASVGLTKAGGALTSNLSTGVAGGQTIIGGLNAANNLVLSTTSNASKGKIFFGSNSAYQESNIRLGIGTSTPSASIQVNGVEAATVTSIIRGFTSQTANLTEWQNSLGTVVSQLSVGGRFATNATLPGLDDSVNTTNYYLAGNRLIYTATSQPVIDAASRTLKMTTDRGAILVYGSGGAGATGPIIDYDINSNATAGFTFARLVNGTLSGALSGNNTAVLISPTYNPAAGSGVFRALDINYTNNASGAQSGSSTGLRVNRNTSGTAFTTDIIADFQAAGASLFLFTAAGNLTMASSTARIFLGGSTSQAGFTYDSSSTGLIIRSNRTSAAGYCFNFSSGQGPITTTSGANGRINLGQGFSPTSGTGTWAGITVAETINQTGGANGITRGLFVNPTLTSASDYRGVQIDAGGDTIIAGRNTTSAAVQIDSTVRGFLPPRMTTTQKNAITSPVAGLVIYDTTLNKLCVYTTAWETITSI